MKKLLPLLLVVLMLTCLLCACGNDGKKDDGNKTVTTTQPVGDTTGTAAETKVYYKTDAAGSTITTVIVLPSEGETFPIETAAPTQSTTEAPTFTYEDENQFNDATLAW